jgi:hypothetical protein
MAWITLVWGKQYLLSQFYLEMSSADTIEVYSGKTMFRHFFAAVWSCIKNRLTLPP